MEQLDYSIVIIGSGISGLYTALKLSNKLKNGQRILIVTKSPLGESNTRYAQGGIASVMSENIKDSVQLYINDTLKSGAGLNDESIVRYISEISEDTIKDLIKYGVEFDSDDCGNFAYTLGGGHSAKRVLHSGEDITGMCIINSLVKAVKSSQNIDIMEKSMAVEFLVSEDKCIQGLIIYNKNTNKHILVRTSTLISAAGGACQVYKYTTNPYGATGDTIALAYNVGAEIQDMEFIQFHPTALVLNPNNRTRFLISEAVRGEGAKLINNNKEEFMVNYTNMKELASRDIVTRAIISEINNGKTVYLDTSVIDRDKLLKRFPTIAKKCKTNGIDITKEPIPVAPAAHYTIGGIKADINGKTSINGFYAIGENSSINFHGANRLASNSLLECAVCSYTLAETLNTDDLKIPECFDNNVNKIIEEYSTPINQDFCNTNEIKIKLQDVMWNNVGIIRTEESLLKAQKDIEKLKTDFKRKRKCLSMNEYECRNMLINAFLITKSALLRKESRGAHYRSDYPHTNAIATHSIIQKEF